MLTNNDNKLAEYELPNGITIIVTLQALKRLDKFFSENERIDCNALFKQAKAMQAYNDIHCKLTANNAQKIVVEHKTKLSEAEKMQMRRRIMTKINLNPRKPMSALIGFLNRLVKIF